MPRQSGKQPKNSYWKLNLFWAGILPLVQIQYLVLCYSYVSGMSDLLKAHQGLQLQVRSMQHIWRFSACMCAVWRLHPRFCWEVITDVGFKLVLHFHGVQLYPCSYVPIPSFHKGIPWPSLLTGSLPAFSPYSGATDKSLGKPASPKL